MQTMSADQQQQMYYNPAAAAAAAAAAGHPPSSPFFIPQNDFQPSIRPQHIYTQRMGQPQYINQGMPAQMQPVYHLQNSQYLPQASYVSASNPRAMGPQYMPMARTGNENLNNQMNFMPPAGYSAYANSNLSPATQMYQQQFFPASYSVAPNYTQQAPQMSNAPQIPAQPQQYTLAANFNPVQAPQQMPQPAPLQQHQQIDPSHIPTSQSAPVLQAANEKRPRKPLLIVNPDTKAALVVPQTAPVAPVPTTTTTTTSVTRPVESRTDSGSVAPPVKTTENTIKVQDTFRRQVAEALGKPNDENSSNNLSVKAAAAPAPRAKSPTPVASSTSKESTTSQSSTLSDQASQAYPGIRTGNIPEEKVTTPTPATKVNVDETNKLVQIKPTVDDVITQSETVQISQPAPLTSTESKTGPLLSTTESLECFTPPQTPTVKNEPTLGPSTSQRLRYDRDELIRIRDSSSALSIPANLPDLDIIINRRENQRFPYPTTYTGTNSHGRANPNFNRQVSGGGNHPSLTRYPNNAAQDSRRKTGGIYLSNEPDFANRVEKPYKPIDQTKLDANLKVLRDIKAILNKVTPQTYEKLQKQLEGLEVDRYERLEGMITIFFSKAVDEPAFSFLYARLCKQFQKKQVTVPNEEGKPVTYFFRQILLTRCQKEFENDYRQEIEYEKRKAEVELITDEKKRKEESEKLEEDLVKAKRRKLGNIFFIGELFKLQMLTDTIMYDCIEYLLRDKTDEESLECLCRLLRTIGKELDGKASEKAFNKNNLEKHYRELEQIIKEQKTSARIRFMIQDLMELRHAAWVARRAEAKPMTIDEIHEEARVKRAQQERDQERDRQQRRDPNRPTVIGTAYSGGNQQQYNDSRGSRGSGIRTQNNRNDDDRVENRFNVNAVRQLQSNDRRGQGPMAMNLAPQRTWGRGSGVEKKAEEDPSFAARGGKPPAGPVQQLKGKAGSSQEGASGYPLQRQSSRELARENSHRDRENALLSLRKTTTGSGINSPGNAAVGGGSSMANSREGSRNVSREQSRNASRESSVSERTSNASLTARISKTSALDSSTIINTDPSDTSFDEEKTQARVHALIEEYTENYSESSDRPVKEALEDLAAFRTANLDQQATIVRELFVNVLEGKPRARKAVGHLLDAALNDELLSSDAFLAGFKMLVEYTPDYAVDIPLIWQYIGEILGAFIGAPSSNLALVKPILQHVPQEKSKQLFQYIIRYATEFSSQSHLQKLWHSSGLSLDDLLRSDLIDESMAAGHEWLTEGSLEQSKENLSPRADPQLVKLFKSFNDQNTPASDPEIIAYIQQFMDPTEKFYIRNIVLSYLEACLINRDPQRKIQEEIATKRMTVLNAIIQHKPEAEIQAVYAIQNFVSKLEHPPKMARLLFDIFYDEECVSEDAFFDWLKQPDQSETEGHSVVEMSTKDFFTWLQQAETEVEEGEEEGN